MTTGGIDYHADGGDEMSIRDYWALARRRRWYIIVPVLFALGFSLASSMSTTPMYRAKADVLVQAAPVPGAVSSETAMTPRTLNNELLRAQGSALKDQARSVVGAEPTMDVALARDRDADLFVFTAESRSADRAADAANAYAETYVASRKADLAADFQSQADVLQQQLDDAADRLAESSEGAGAEELRVIIAGYRADIDEVQTAAKLAEESGATIVNVAEAPESPYAPQPIRSAALAVLLALFVGIAAAFVRDYTDNHIRTPDALEAATGLPTGAVVPRLKGWKKAETHVVILEDSSSPQAEAYRSLRARIQFRRVDRQIRALMVTSARPGEGKTTTSSNLAVAFAAAGENTVLVDLDMRRPRIHKFFSLGNEHGMSTVLLGADLETAIRPLTSVPNLSVVPAGPSTGEASEILHDESLERVIGELRQRFDIVVIDTPPVLAVADPLTISHYCDGALLVVSAAGTDKRDAGLAAGQLSAVNAPMIGAVLNNYSAAETGYSYSYAYSDYTSPPEKIDRAPKWGNEISGSVDDDPVVSAHNPPKLSRKQRKNLAKLGHSEPQEASTPSLEPEPMGWAPQITEGTGESLPADHFEISSSASSSELESPSETNALPLTEFVVTDSSDLNGEQATWPASPSVESNAAASASDNEVESPDGIRTMKLEGPEEATADIEYTNSGLVTLPDMASASEYQQYLRSELRRAREEHVPKGPADATA